MRVDKIETAEINRNSQGNRAKYNEGEEKVNELEKILRSRNKSIEMIAKLKN